MIWRFDYFNMLLSVYRDAFSKIQGYASGSETRELILALIKH